MSVGLNVLSFWGILLEGYDRALSEAMYDLDDDHMLEHAFDGMNGEYMVLGVKLFDSGNVYRDEPTARSTLDLTTGYLPQQEALYKSMFLKRLPQFGHLMDRPFRIITFSHYH